jgi:ubiquitin-protein ligase
MYSSRLASHTAIFRIPGPEDTPYANGCFFFDIFLDDYPKSPPKVCFLTTGNGKVRFNPNLYKCGKVCLSLLGTWSGPSWVPNQSTLLQVLVSIQGLILVPEPFYNEPGYTKSKANEKQSELYDKNTRRSTLQHGICDYLDAIFPPAQRAAAAVSPDYPEFQTILIRHFCQRAPAILIMIDDWVKQDASLRTTTNRIRSQLDKLVQEYGQQPAKQDETLVDSDAEGDKKPAAKPTPQVYEIDD